MRQGIDPTTHKPLLNTNTESHIKQETEKPSMLMPLSQEILASLESSLLMSDSNYYHAGLASREVFMNKPTILDPLCYLEFQMAGGISQNCHPSLRQFDEKNQLGSNSSNGIYFSSMPCLNSSDDQGINVSVTEFSNNNNSASSNSSSMSIFPGEAGFSSWEGNQNKLLDLDPLLEFQVINGVKSEEFKASTWEEGQLLMTHSHNSVDFTTSYPLTSLSENLSGASFDVFQQL